MSIFFATQQEAEQARIDARERLNHRRDLGFFEDPDGNGGIFEGILHAGVSAFARGGEGLNEVARLRWLRESNFGIGPATGIALDSLLPDEPTDWERYFTRNRDYWSEMRREHQVDPATRSEAANLIAGIVETVGAYSFAGLTGGPLAPVTAPTAGISYGREEEENLLAQGVDPETARSGGRFTGTMMALMGAAPVALPGRIWQRAASGAGINMSLGVVMRGGMNAHLTEQGYPELASRYQWMDRQAMAIDGILGATFGKERR